MKRFEAVIFDLDGVIVDTAHFHFVAWKKLANQLGFELEDDLNSKLKGVGRMDALDQILSYQSLNLNLEQKQALAVLKNQWYLEMVNQLTGSDILPGILVFLKELKASNMKIGLASASKNARFVLDRLKLTNYFTYIADGTNTKKAKPDPEVFLNCANHIGVQPEQCLVIEDAIAGIQGANAAGMSTIGVGDTQELAEAELVINSTGLLNLALLESKFNNA